MNEIIGRLEGLGFRLERYKGGDYWIYEVDKANLDPGIERVIYQYDPLLSVVTILTESADGARLHRIEVEPDDDFSELMEWLNLGEVGDD